jgi:hypothetical protein
MWKRVLAIIADSNKRRGEVRDTGMLVCLRPKRMGVAAL